MLHERTPPTWLNNSSRDVLVEMVKLAQRRGMSGSKGVWKEFLASYDKKLGSSLSDPARRSVDSLDAFLKTFTEEDDLKVFKKVLQCYSNRDKVEQFKKTPIDKQTDEERLVHLTLGHLLYSIEYCFPSHEEEWLLIKCKKVSKIRKSTAIIAVDCEMVLCEDGTEALVRVCAVDRNLQVKLDEIVNPNKAIADYRTDITGISAKDLDGVTCTLADVQKSMKKLLSHGNILVGHSLNNDLQALKLDHSRVIDTSYIFKYANGPISRKPSLRFLCKAMLGYELRETGKPHNCLDDACAAMKLVLARLEGKVDGVISDEMKELEVAKLLLHSIPAGFPSKDLQSVIPGDCTIEVKTNKKNVRNTYSAFAIFKNQQEADEAFENLGGDLAEDSFGRPQKLVKFELDSGSSGTLKVGKVGGQFTSNKRPFDDEDTCMKSKKSKIDQTYDCETHSKEIEILKQVVSQRDQEISDLKKIVAALTRKQGL